MLWASSKISYLMDLTTEQGPRVHSILISCKQRVVDSVGLVPSNAMIKQLGCENDMMCVNMNIMNMDLI